MVSDLCLGLALVLEPVLVEDKEFGKYGADGTVWHHSPGNLHCEAGVGTG